MSNQNESVAISYDKVKNIKIYLIDLNKVKKYIL